MWLPCNSSGCPTFFFKKRKQTRLNFPDKKDGWPRARFLIFHTRQDCLKGFALLLTQEGVEGKNFNHLNTVSSCLCLQHLHLRIAKPASERPCLNLLHFSKSAALTCFAFSACPLFTVASNHEKSLHPWLKTMSTRSQKGCL